MASLTRGSRLLFVVCLQVLLHVVGAGELFLAACESAVNSFLSGVDLGVARGVARGSKCLFAAVAVAIATWVALAGPVGHGRCGGLVGEVIVKGCGARALGVGCGLG